MVWIWRALSSLLISGLQLMKVKQIKERDCYIRGVNTVINAAIPPPFPFWFPALSEPQVSLLSALSPLPALTVIHKEVIDTNWDSMITICTNQPMSANLSRENSNIMANLHLSLNALDDICSQLKLSREVSANRQTSRSVLFQHICIHRSENAFTWKYSWQNLIKYFQLKTSISKCSVKKF